MKLASLLAIAVGAVSGCSTIYEDDTRTLFDPLAPNWHIEQSRVDDDRFRIALKKKRFTTGGDGEAAQVFYRRANLIALEHGSGRYRVIEFSEGIESTVPIAQRIAQGVIEVVH